MENGHSWKELFAPYVRYYTSLDLDIMVMLIAGILQPISLAHETFLNLLSPRQA